MNPKKILISYPLTQSHYMPAIIALILILISLNASIGVLWAAILISILIAITIKTPTKLKLVIIGAFFIRVLLIFVDDYLGLLPYQWDGYYKIATAIKKNILDGAPFFSGLNPPGNTKAYSLFTSLQYLLLGDINLIAKITNAFFAILAVLRIYHISLKVFDQKKVAFYTALLLAFLPSYMVYSSLDLRDSLIMFVSIDLIYRLIQYGHTQKITTLFFFILGMVLMAFLRPQNIPLYLFIFVLYLFMSYIHGRSILYKLNISVLSLTILLLFLKWLDFAGISEQIFSTANLIVSSRDWGGSAYLQGFQYNNWFDVFKNLPIRFFYFTFGPLPWDINNLFMLLSFFEVLFILTFAIFTLNYWRRSDGLNKYQLLLLIFCAVGLAANSLLDSNYGTAIRHRLNYIFVFLMFGSAYLQKYRIKFL